MTAIWGANNFIRSPSPTVAFPPSMAAVPSVQALTGPVHLILDFDGTITTQDTTALLADIASNAFRTVRTDAGGFLEGWRQCEVQYAADLQALGQVWAEQRERKTVADEIMFQRGLRDVEKASVIRCGEVGFFRGISDHAWREAGLRECRGSKVKIREGFESLVLKVDGQLDGKGRWGVVSVNWSQHFLRGVLEFALNGELPAQSVPVLSNHINGETGMVEGPNGDMLMLSCADKLLAMKSMSNAFRASAAVQDNQFTAAQSTKDPFRRTAELQPPPPVVFVGDSLTDLECLLEADVGIVMSADGRGTLIETLERYAISVPHIFFWAPGSPKSLWFATDFQQIARSRLFA